MGDEKWTRPNDSNGLALDDLRALYDSIKDDKNASKQIVDLANVRMPELVDRESNEQQRFCEMIRAGLESTNGGDDMKQCLKLADMLEAYEMLNNHEEPEYIKLPLPDTPKHLRDMFDSLVDES